MRHTAEAEKVGGGPRGAKVLQHAEVKVTLVLKGTARREYLSRSGILQKRNVLTDNRRLASEAVLPQLWQAQSCFVPVVVSES